MKTLRDPCRSTASSLTLTYSQWFENPLHRDLSCECRVRIVSLQSELHGHIESCHRLSPHQPIQMLTPNATGGLVAMSLGHGGWEWHRSIHYCVHACHWIIRACYFQLSENLHGLISPVDYALRCGAWCSRILVLNSGAVAIMEQLWTPDWYIESQLSWETSQA